LIRLFITLKDIGFRRLCLRFRHQSLRVFYSINPNYWLIRNKKLIRTPTWIAALKDLENHDLVIENIKNLENKIKKISFNFQEKERKLDFPINWNNKSWSRLWQFNLHYFDWARISIDKSFENNNCDEKLIYIENLINEWINGNSIGLGDGWHSYTLSLRIRNWIWIFRTFPNFITPLRLNSLWIQICWLYKNPENFIGGNHWLENLITLTIGSLQFKNNYSDEIYFYSIKNLKKELNTQILKDGGHEERSAAYHILILDRLIEMAFVIQDVKRERPIWLIRSIEKMLNWLLLIELKEQKFPIFNDSPIDICSDIKTVQHFAISYLNNTENSLKGIRRMLSKISKNSELASHLNYASEISKPEIVDLDDTGWLILRLPNDWEFIYKCGKSCPNHLPAHCHSDLLSFDLLKKGKPIIAECGTSLYGNNKKREFERSGAAHNVLRLSLLKNNNHKNWIEPIDIWDNFRAGRKARITNKSYKKIKNKFSIRVSHDGFKNIGVSYERIINLKRRDNGDMELNTIEIITSKKNLIANQIINFGPYLDPSLFPISISNSNSIFNIKSFWYDSYLSLGFGKTIPRKSLCYEFTMPKGKHEFSSKIFLRNKNF